MTHKSLRIFVQTLVLGLLLGTWSTAYADAVSTTSGSFSNLQIIPTIGNIQFGTWQASASAVAMNSMNEVNTENDTRNGAPAEASAGVRFATASGSAILDPPSLTGNTVVSISGCTCSASSVQRASLSNTFMIVGGTGNVDVTISGLLTTMQFVRTDEFGVMAESEVIFLLAINGTPVFSHERTLSIPRNSVDQAGRGEELSKIITLQFNTPYTVSLGIGLRSAGANEIPEPATVVLLISGLGYMAAFVKKRRNGL